MTEKQAIMKKSKKISQQKVGIKKKTKRDYKKRLVIDTKDHLKKKKIRKKNVLEINITIWLKKKKNKRMLEKLIRAMSQGE